MSGIENKGLLLRMAAFFNPFHGKQQRMIAETAGEVLLQAPCMTVINLFEMPGVVKVVGDTLVIKPCLGKASELPLAEISSVACPRRFNGTIRKVQFQHGFWIYGGSGWRLGFAVTDDRPWRALFAERGISVSDGI